MVDSQSEDKKITDGAETEDETYDLPYITPWLKRYLFPYVNPIDSIVCFLWILKQTMLGNLHSNFTELQVTRPNREIRQKEKIPINRIIQLPVNINLIILTYLYINFIIISPFKKN